MLDMLKGDILVVCIHIE
uniref:Uncharacterized protein n=1 Tax=Nymphaea colorata TaxID=210225 RepID=A0A5K0ZWZ9_9MAGN